MNRFLVGTTWILIYLLLAAGPAWLMTVVPPLPGRRDFWTELSLALGFIGLAQLLIQFVLVARFSPITAPYGIDIILHYHRQIGALAVLAVLAHPFILLVRHPSMLYLLNPAGSSAASRAGVLAAVALALVVGLSWLRRRLGIGYEMWRISHLVLAIVAVIASLLHIMRIESYVNTSLKSGFWIALACLLVAPLVYQRLVKPFLALRRAYRVTGVRREHGDTWTLEVELFDQRPPMHFEPGQFVWMKLRNPFSVDEHPFSFSSSAETPQRLEFGIKEVGDFTRAIATVPIGTPVYLEGPHGAFSIDRIPSAGYVFIAVGIGVAPFISMIRTMADRRDRRPVLLIYADRSLDDLAYREELDRLSQQADRMTLQVVYVLDEPPKGWSGETGRVTPEVLGRILPEERIRRDFLICGPDVMIVSVERALLGLGIEPRRLHAERFELV